VQPVLDGVGFTDDRHDALLELVNLLDQIVK
jgi:hypothetical protein